MFRKLWIFPDEYNSDNSDNDNKPESPKFRTNRCKYYCTVIKPLNPVGRYLFKKSNLVDINKM